VTQKTNLSQLDSSVNFKIALNKGLYAHLLRYSTDSVSVELSVEKVTEAAYSIPVLIVGEKQNLKIFPDKVEIICRIPLSEYSHIKATDFLAQVEFLPSSASEKKLQVKLVKTPEKVTVLKINPAEVEYIIISK
jgi:hypothetical protein